MGGNRRGLLYDVGSDQARGDVVKTLSVDGSLMYGIMEDVNRSPRVEQPRPNARRRSLRRSTAAGIIAQHWGFTSLRPLQEQAMQAVLDGRDSLVVLPTGGGKSLCYQAPAVLPRRHHRRRLAAHRPDERPGR